MGYLNKLKELCAQYTENANTKEELDFSVNLQNTINGLEQEESQTLKNYDELKAAYKEAVLHGTFGSTDQQDRVDGTKSISFEEYVNRKFNN